MGAPYSHLIKHLRNADYYGKLGSSNHGQGSNLGHIDGHVVFYQQTTDADGGRASDRLPGETAANLENTRES